mmetsp:Transcript_43713/g.114895  ORF Transcript_43713/g.114895 Transcript_43713/m.114895 type:complete len:377 (-) Transcript_43713:582-1712(-)
MQRALWLLPRGRLLLPLLIPQRTLDLVEEVAQRRLLRLHLAHRLVGEVHPLVPRLEQEEKAQLARGHAHLKRLPDGDEILEGLGHLEALDEQVAKVPEVVDPLATTMERLRLAQLVVVVREGEIMPASVNVHIGSHDVRGHHRALNVPAGPAAAPRRVPRGLACLGRLPQRKVRRRALLTRPCRVCPLGLCHLRLSRLALARLELRVRVPSGLVRSDVHVHRSVRLVRQPLGDDPLDEAHDLGHVLCHSRQAVRRANVERLHVVQKLGLVSARVRLEDLVLRDRRALLRVEDLRERLGCRVDDRACLRLPVCKQRLDLRLRRRKRLHLVLLLLQELLTLVLLTARLERHLESGQLLLQLTCECVARRHHLRLQLRG